MQPFSDGLPWCVTRECCNGIRLGRESTGSGPEVPKRENAARINKPVLDFFGFPCSGRRERGTSRF